MPDPSPYGGCLCCCHRDVLLRVDLHRDGVAPDLPAGRDGHRPGAAEGHASARHQAGEAGGERAADPDLPQPYGRGSSREAARRQVNRWIRTSGEFDAVVDTDALLRDPAEPREIRETLRHDCYHPNAARDALIGGFIPLWVLGVPVADHAPLRVGEEALIAP